jgi:hypothetical protein
MYYIPGRTHSSTKEKHYHDTRQMVLQLHFNGTNLRHPPADIAPLRLNLSFHANAILPVKIGYKSITQLVTFAQ